MNDMNNSEHDLLCEIVQEIVGKDIYNSDEIAFK